MADELRRGPMRLRKAPLDEYLHHRASQDATRGVTAVFVAVHATMQRTGVGALLLGDACRRAAMVAREVAFTAVIVDAIDASAAACYATFGFVAYPELPFRLFLPMHTIDGLDLR